MSGKIIRFTLGLLFLILFFALLYKLYIPRINAFGCFDDCFNFMGGHFLLEGKRIFTDFYYNHQPGMAFLSYVIQTFTTPDSIPELVLRHRQAVIFLSFALTILLTIRFGLKVIFVVALYELTKFYVFGDRFLAESIVGYILVYLIGINLELLNKRRFRADVFIAPIAGWAIIFLREPFAVPSLFLLIFYLWNFRAKQALYSAILFIVLSLVTISFFNIPDYFFNVVTVNHNLLKSEGSPILELFQSAIYPIHIIFSTGNWTFFRVVLALLSILFIFNLAAFFKLTKNLGALKFILLCLFLINLRPVPPFQTFYEAFHISPWLISFIFIIVYLTFQNLFFSKKIGLLSLVTLVILFVQIITNKQFFIYENVKTHDEFFTNYSHVMDIGTTIRNLSNANDTLFVDGYDDIILWESKLNSSYKYMWYTSFMRNFDKYKSARIEMFAMYPPDFYYGFCPDSQGYGDAFMKKVLDKSYTRISPPKQISCIYILNSTLQQIPDEKIHKLDGTMYSVPKILDK